MGSFLKKMVSSFAKRSKVRSGKCDYTSLYRMLSEQFGTEEAVKKGVGGEFEAFGKIELALLVHLGLMPHHYLIDVGCGSGRLSSQLAGYLQGRYLGTDVVRPFLEHARAVTPRSDWRFELVDELVIPEEAAQADLVCFFSVMTHLLHEQSFVYLQEACRVLKSGGRIVFSFLDFSVPDHWAIFELNVNDVDKNMHPLNMFLWQEAIICWASKLGLQVERFISGNSPEIPLSSPVTFSNGTVVLDRCSFGQSVCVLKKP